MDHISPCVPSRLCICICIRYRHITKILYVFFVQFIRRTCVHVWALLVSTKHFGVHVCLCVVYTFLTLFCELLQRWVLCIFMRFLYSVCRLDEFIWNGALAIHVNHHFTKRQKPTMNVCVLLCWFLGFRLVLFLSEQECFWTLHERCLICLYVVCMHKRCFVINFVTLSISFSS